MGNERYIVSSIKQDLKNKMVFVGGARQVGKTTLAFSLLNPANATHPAYLNWDIVEHQKRIQNHQIPLKEPLIVFDEIHKFSRWRNYLKGLYDAYHNNSTFLITGSARLDYYRKGGDSLLGRYHYYRLHPFSLNELSSKPNSQDLEQLLTFGGFPEPLFSGSQRQWKRWQSERNKRVIYEDLRDLENVREVSLIDLLAEALPSKVGSPLSIKSIKEDLQVSHQSVEKWITILENLYLVFRLSPFGSPKIRAVKKEQKLYFYDWSHLEDKGKRFENFVASHLLKYCHFVEDTEGDKMELQFIRDTDKREIDFVVLKNKHPQFAVECKSGENALSSRIEYFKNRTRIPRFYQVHLGTKDYGNENVNGRVLPFVTFCKELQIP